MQYLNEIKEEKYSVNFISMTSLYDMYKFFEPLLKRNKGLNMLLKSRHVSFNEGNVSTRSSR